MNIWANFKHLIFIGIIFIAAAVAGDSASGAGFDYAYGVTGFGGLLVNSNFWDPDTRNFDRDEAYSYSSLYGDLTVASAQTCSVYAAAAVDWLHYFEPVSDDDVDGELVNAYVKISQDLFAVTAGKQPFQIGIG